MDASLETTPCPKCGGKWCSVDLCLPQKVAADNDVARALRELVVRAISVIKDAERETYWGSPTFGPTPSEEIQAALDALVRA